MFFFDYVLSMCATKQIGALFFSLAFLATSVLLRKYIVHKYLSMSAVVIAILFGSIEIELLLYVTYPPFGLITMSFKPVGSYLLYSGIVNSATVVSIDRMLRGELYSSALTRLELLKPIGITEMEKETVRNYKSIQTH